MKTKTLILLAAAVEAVILGAVIIAILMRQ